MRRAATGEAAPRQDPPDNRRMNRRPAFARASARQA